MKQEQDSDLLYKVLSVITLWIKQNESSWATVETFCWCNVTNWRGSTHLSVIPDSLAMKGQIYVTLTWLLRV